MNDETKPIVVDIGAAYAMLQENPELCAAMNEMVGGPALVAAHAEVDRLVAALKSEAEYFESTYGPHMGMSGNTVGKRLRAHLSNAGQLAKD